MTGFDVLEVLELGVVGVIKGLMNWKGQVVVTGLDVLEVLEFGVVGVVQGLVNG